MRILILGASCAHGRALFRALAENDATLELCATVGFRAFHFEGVTGLKHQRSLVFEPFEDDWNKLGKVDVLINCISIATEKKHAPQTIIQKISANRALLGNPRIIQVSVSGATLATAENGLNQQALADQQLLCEPNTWVIRPGLICSRSSELVNSVQRIKEQIGLAFFPKTMLDAQCALLTENDFTDAVLHLIEHRFPDRLVDLYSSERITFRDVLREAEVRVWFFPERLGAVLSGVFQRFFPSVFFVQTHLAKERTMAGAGLLGREFGSAKHALVRLLQPSKKAKGFSENFN
jgi:hypothetical protein